MSLARTGVCSTCRVALRAGERCDQHETARVVPGAELCVLHREAPTSLTSKPITPYVGKKRSRTGSFFMVSMISSLVTTVAEILVDLDLAELASTALFVGGTTWFAMDRWAKNATQNRAGGWRTSPEIARHAEQGRVGTIVGEPVLRAPLSGKECVAYGLVIEDAAGSGVLVDAHAARFALRGDDGAVIELTNDRWRFESLVPPDQTSRGAAPTLRALSALGIEAQTTLLANARCEEHLVRAGDRVSLLTPSDEAGRKRWPVLVLMRRATPPT